MISTGHRLLAATFIAAGVWTLPPIHAQTGGQLAGPIEIEGGLVSGIAGWKPGITAFKGVPFAAAPTGERRWKAPRRVADMVSSSWVNFATSGDPTGKGLPAWPAADGRNWLTMELRERARAIPVADSADKRAFHERVLARR